MRLYVEVGKRTFQRYLAYRAANLAGLTTNAFWGVLHTFLFLGLYAGRTEQAGWTAHDAVDYVWIAQALIMPLYLWGWWEIGLTIRSGDIASDLTKPFDYYTFWLSQDIGRALYHIIFRFAPTLLFGVLLFGARLPADAGRWAIFALSLALAVWVSFGLRFAYNVAAFWLVDYRGVGAMVSFVTLLLSGHVVPLVYYPDWAREAVRWLPFAGMVQTPVEVLLGKLGGPALATALAQQAGWGLALLLLDRLLLAHGEHKLVIQGG